MADPARRAAVEAAVELLEPGMTLGLGSGRAVFGVVDAVGARWSGAPPFRVVCASAATEALARSAGFEVAALDGRLRLDLALDGADEVGPDLGLVKGGGAALLREKLVVSAAERFVVVAEAVKRVERLGTTVRLPVEVVRFAWEDTARRVTELLGAATLRTDADGTAHVTDEGHFLLDCPLPVGTPDLRELGRAVKSIVGVVEHGLFLDLADAALLGRADGGVDHLQRAR